MWPGNPFRHPAWLAAHTEILEPELRVERWGNDPHDQAVTAHAVGGPLRLAGDRLSDRLDPPLEALLRAAERAEARDQPLRLRRLPLTTADSLARKLGADRATVTDVAASPTVRFAASTWEEYLARPEARRSRRIAAQAERTLAEPSVRVEVASDPDTVFDALEELVRLHHLRFKDRSEVFTEEKHATIAAAAMVMSDDDAASIRTLLIDDQPVAAVFLLAGEGATWFHQTGWDPAFADRSVGRAILVDAMRDACEQGRDFHLLTGDHEYKQWWATDDQPVATVELTRW
ncbi:GNAT family N-acetyltransferase [Aquihabitans daechungensis]|uniref:GNAT family N-acetyltransferase n=1 Tax=Aquihabitans daechungensis TaxID=1052257 RepID=UPI003B9ECDBF